MGLMNYWRAAFYREKGSFTHNAQGIESLKRLMVKPCSGRNSENWISTVKPAQAYRKRKITRGESEEYPSMRIIVIISGAPYWKK